MKSPENPNGSNTSADMEKFIEVQRAVKLAKLEKSGAQVQLSLKDKKICKALF